MTRFRLLAHLLVCLFALAPTAALAARHRSGGGDHVGFGNTITIDEGQSSGDIVCAFCTVRVHGDVSGNIVTFFGDVQVDPNRSISGDSVLFGGNLGLGEQSSLHGSLVLFGGDLSQASTATVHGDRVLFAGSGWLLVLLLPLLIPIGIVWLIVYLVRRQRYQFPAYPGGRF
jgi:predicted acyltransferase (DUF342 family)